MVRLRHMPTTNVPFAVFDFDNTCIVNDIAEAVMAYMARHDLFKCRTILPGLEDLSPRALSEKVFTHYYGLLAARDMRGAYEFGARTLAGLRTADIGPLVEKVLAFEGTTPATDVVFGLTIAKGLQPRAAVKDLMTSLRGRAAVWVVSASPAVLVAEAMRLFGFEAELIGARNVIIDGLITADLEYPMSVMEGKVDCIKSYIDATRRPILGAGDSANDLPMLEYSERRVVINRHNSLTAKAVEAGWELLEG